MNAPAPLRPNDTLTRHMLYPFSNASYAARHPPLLIEGGEGVHVTDGQGKRYIDGMAGLWNVNVGHGRPEIKAAIAAQLDRLSYYSLFGGTTTGPAIDLAEMLCRMTAPEGMVRAFFSSGGSEANEAAFKLAKQYWRQVGEPTRHKVFSLKRAYHGVTLGALSANGTASYREHFEPLMPGFCPGRDAACLPQSVHHGPRGARAPLRGAARARDPLPEPQDRGGLRGRADPGRGRGDRAAGEFLAAAAPGVRPPRRPDDFGRGRHRLRPARQHVRLPALGREPGHHGLRQGDQLGLRAARRDDDERTRRRGLPDRGRVRIHHGGLLARQYLCGPSARLCGRAGQPQDRRGRGARPQRRRGRRLFPGAPQGRADAPLHDRGRARSRPDARRRTRGRSRDEAAVRSQAARRRPHRRDRAATRAC